MTIQAVGTTASLGAVAASAGAAKPGGTADSQSDPAASTIVISRVTVTHSDGSTTTTITYADGHTETETTPPQQSTKGQSTKGQSADGEKPGTQGRITAVDLLV